MSSRHASAPTASRAVLRAVPSRAPAAARRTRGVPARLPRIAAAIANAVVAKRDTGPGAH